VLVPDVNVLLAAFRPGHPHHAPALGVLSAAHAGAPGAPVLGLADLALASVLRLATNPRVFPDPDDPADVLDYLDALVQPPAVLLTGSPGTWRRFASLCREQGLRGNAVPDAHLASLALEHRAELVTFDRGFARYPGLRWSVPQG